MRNTIISSIIKAEDTIIRLIFVLLCHIRKQEDNSSLEKDNIGSDS